MLDTEYLVSVIASESWNLSNSYIYSLNCTTLPFLHASQLYIKKNLSLNSGNKCNNSLCSESCRVFLHTFYLKRLSMWKGHQNISTDKVMKIAVFEKLMQISSEWISLTFIYFTFYKKKTGALWVPKIMQKIAKSNLQKKPPCII